MQLLFFGTPEFAVPALQRLIESPHSVLAVVTQPDRPQGRGRRPSPSAVKLAAQAAKLPVLEPDSLRASPFLKEIQRLKPEVAVVVAYGRLLPLALLQLFPRGAYNLHPSLLPKFRGAAPIPWAILLGESETGITIFQLDEMLDHGPILLQAKHPIDPEDTAMTLSQKLAELGSLLMLKGLDLIGLGSPPIVSQKEEEATYAPVLKKGDGIIDWKSSCLEIHRRIRAVQPWPGAQTWVNGRSLKLIATTPDPGRHDPHVPYGTVVLADPKAGLWVQTAQGQLRINRLQPAGGKVLKAADFLLGHPLPVGTVLTGHP